jgi:site-specific DNA-methyltransferase (adenine-specific)
MGIKQVPCILADKLTEDQIKAYRLADNMTSMNSKWNGKLVRLEMKALPEFDFTKFGMPEKFMDFKDRIKVEEDDFDEGQFIVNEPHSKQGDLYLLGNHRLLVGDSTDAEQVKRLIENEEVDLVVTDPPYNVNYEGSDGQTIKNDFMDKEAYKAFLDKVFINLKASLKEGGAFYIWFATMELRNIINSLFDVGLDFRSMLIWKKPSPNLSYADYKWIYEPCMYGWKDGSHNFYGGLTCTNFLEFDKPRKNDLHPTMKPLDLFGYLIQNSSKEHQRVLDLFGGSGTTIICCEDLNRKGLAMEFDEKYADVIVKRYLRHG